MASLRQFLLINAQKGMNLVNDKYLQTQDRHGITDLGHRTIAIGIAIKIET